MLTRTPVGQQRAHKKLLSHQHWRQAGRRRGALEPVEEKGDGSGATEPSDQNWEIKPREQLGSNSTSREAREHCWGVEAHRGRPAEVPLKVGASFTGEVGVERWKPNLQEDVQLQLLHASLPSACCSLYPQCHSCFLYLKTPPLPTSPSVQFLPSFVVSPFTIPCVPPLTLYTFIPSTQQTQYLVYSKSLVSACWMNKGVNEKLRLAYTKFNSQALLEYYW